jgi:hypothetical protein
MKFDMFIKNIQLYINNYNCQKQYVFNKYSNQSFYKFNKWIYFFYILKENRQLKYFFIISSFLLLILISALLIFFIPYFSEMINYLKENGLQNITNTLTEISINTTDKIKSI